MSEDMIGNAGKKLEEQVRVSSTYASSPGSATFNAAKGQVHRRTSSLNMLKSSLWMKVLPQEYARASGDAGQNMSIPVPSMASPHSNLDKVLAKLPKFGEHSSASFLSREANNTVHLDEDSVEANLRKFSELSRQSYHPAYERDASFDNASTLKVSVIPVRILEQESVGEEHPSAHDSNKDKLLLSAVSKLDCGNEDVPLKDAYEFYTNYMKKRMPKKQKKGRTTSKPLPNLDWKRSHLKFALLRQDLTAYRYDRVANTFCTVEKDNSTPAVRRQSTHKSEWDCLRVYIQPVFVIAVLCKSELEGDCHSAAEIHVKMQKLLTTLREQHGRLIFCGLVLDDSKMQLQSFCDATTFQRMIVHVFVDSVIADREKSGANHERNVAHEAELCRFHNVMSMIAALSVYYMELWLLQASPASWTITTPLDLIRTADSQGVNDDEFASTKYSNVGRIRKLLGDYCLLMRSPDDALIHYAVALDVSKECNDVLWHASALEGVCASDVCAFMDDLKRNGKTNDRKIYQLWLSVRQASEQALFLYSGLPTLRSGLLSKLTQFGSFCLSRIKSQKYKLDLLTQAGRYLNMAVDNVGDLKVVIGKEQCAFCFSDIATNYERMGHLRKASYYALRASSSLPDQTSTLALMMIMQAARLHGLSVDYSGQKLVPIQQKTCRNGCAPIGRSCQWPQLLQTIKLGIISLALSQENFTLAARTAFSFLEVYQAFPSEDFDLDQKEWKWIFRCIFQVKKDISANSRSSKDKVYHETKHCVAFVQHLALVMSPNIQREKCADQQGKDGTRKSVFLYNPFKDESDAKDQMHLIPAGEKITVRVTLYNPFPIGVYVSCRLSFSQLSEEQVDIITSPKEVKLQANGRVVHELCATLYGAGTVQLSGCALKMSSYAWLQKWHGTEGKPGSVLKVIKNIPILTFIKLSSASEQDVTIANTSTVPIESAECELKCRSGSSNLNLRKVQAFYNRDLGENMPLHAGTSHTFPNWLLHSIPGHHKHIEEIEMCVKYRNHIGSEERTVSSTVYYSPSFPLSVIHAEMYRVQDTSLTHDEKRHKVTEILLQSFISLSMRNYITYPIEIKSRFLSSSKSAHETLLLQPIERIVIPIPRETLPALLMKKAEYKDKPRDFEDWLDSEYTMEVSYCKDGERVHNHLWNDLLKSAIMKEICAGQFFPLKICYQANTQAWLNDSKIDDSTRESYHSYSSQLCISNLCSSDLSLFIDLKPHADDGTDLFLCGQMLSFRTLLPAQQSVKYNLSLLHHGSGKLEGFIHIEDWKLKEKISFQL